MDLMNNKILNILEINIMKWKWSIMFETYEIAKI